MNYSYTCPCQEHSELQFAAEDIDTIDNLYHDELEYCYWIIDKTGYLSGPHTEIDPIFDRKWIIEQAQETAYQFLSNERQIWCGDCGDQIKIIVSTN